MTKYTGNQMDNLPDPGGEQHDSKRATLVDAWWYEGALTCMTSEGQMQLPLQVIDDIILKQVGEFSADAIRDDSIEDLLFLRDWDKEGLVFMVWGINQKCYELVYINIIDLLWR